jgi:hypothetical protein
MTKKRRPKPLARFRVYSGSLYYLIVVWRTKKEMLDNRPTIGLPRSSCDAHTFSYDEFADKARKRKLPVLGEIHFHKRKLLAECGVEAVTHETFHAPAGLLRRLGFDFARINGEGMDRPKENHEEIAADAQGKMARMIMFRLHEFGLFPWQEEK